jgi:hypothetical protein
MSATMSISFNETRIKQNVGNVPSGDKVLASLETASERLSRDTEKQVLAIAVSRITGMVCEGQTNGAQTAANEAVSELIGLACKMKNSTYMIDFLTGTSDILSAFGNNIGSR